MYQQLKECPFCGYDVNTNDLMDTINPLNRERTLWNVVCQECTASITGVTKQHTIDLWNTRVIK